MPKKLLKDPKGSFLFTSMVASAALAPILTGQLEQDEKDDNNLQPILPTFANMSKIANVSSQGITSLPQNQSWKNDEILIAAHLEKRKSNVINFISIKEKKNIPAITLEMEKEDELTSENVETIWPENTKLSLGDNGSKVETIQKYLKEIGYYVNDVDGIFGNKTFEAVKLYQKEHGLKIDGIVGKETIEKIVGTKQLIENDLNTSEDNVQLAQVYVNDDMLHLNLYIRNDLLEARKNTEQKKFFEYGDKDKQIANLQKKLKMANYYSGPIDGIFGTKTQQAVRALQRDHQLTVDGLAGKEVMNFLSTNDLQEIAKKRKEKIAESKSVSNNAPSLSNETKTNNVSPETDQRYTASETNNYSEAIIHFAEKYIGTPYQWGGASPSGFDCSGFLVYVFNQFGKSLPRTVKDIWNATTAVSNPRRGDIVFFQTYTKGPSHAGIYLGNGQFIHSGTSTGVTISNINDSYWKARYLGARSY